MNVIQLGLGAIGLSITKLLAGSGSHTIVGAIDPAHAGKSLSQMASLKDDLGIALSSSLDDLRANRILGDDQLDGLDRLRDAEPDEGKRRFRRD